MREKALRPDHPGLAVFLSNLALLYHDQGRECEAEPLLERTLSIMEKALGPGDAYVGQVLNNLAGLYHVQGRDSETEPQARPRGLGAGARPRPPQCRRRPQ